MLDVPISFLLPVVACLPRRSLEGEIIVRLDNLKADVLVVQIWDRLTAEVVVVRQAKVPDLNGGSL